jgi:hypothetical protein
MQVLLVKRNNLPLAIGSTARVLFFVNRSVGLERLVSVDVLLLSRSLSPLPYRVPLIVPYG